MLSKPTSSLLSFLTNKNFFLFFILFFALVFRLYEINAHIVGYHSWRQADTITIAKNFYENGYNIFYPQIDWGGDTPGYVETEFPIFQYILAIIFTFTGISEVAGRSLSIFFSLLTIVFIYKIVKKLSNEKIALWASFFFAVAPLTIFTGRAIMPESLLIFTIVSGCYFFIEWIDGERKTDYILALLLITLSCLIKPPSLYIGLPLGYLAWHKYKQQVFSQPKLWVFGAVMFLALSLWYIHAHQIYLQTGLTFGIWEYGSDKWGNWSILATSEYWSRIFGAHIGMLLFAWIGYPIFFAGFFLKRTYDREYFFDFLTLSILIFFLIVNQGNFWHFYYQLPFSLPASYYMGKVFGRFFILKNKKALIFMTTILAFLLSSSFFVYTSILMPLEKTENSEKYELAMLINKNTTSDELIIILDNNDPTILYLSQRKGWHGVWDLNFEKNIDLEKKISKGAKFFAGSFAVCELEANCNELINYIHQYQIVVETDKFFVVQLSQ